MKIRLAQITNNEYEWHLWFAWRPVVTRPTEFHSLGWAWLERVVRRRETETEPYVAGTNSWMYRTTDDHAAILLRQKNDA